MKKSKSSVLEQKDRNQTENLTDNFKNVSRGTPDKGLDGVDEDEYRMEDDMEIKKAYKDRSSSGNYSEYGREPHEENENFNQEEEDEDVYGDEDANEYIEDDDEDISHNEDSEDLQNEDEEYK